MKYARDSRTSLSSEETAQLLFEALPWIKKNPTGKTVDSRATAVRGDGRRSAAPTS